MAVTKYYYLCGPLSIACNMQPSETAAEYTLAMDVQLLRSTLGFAGAHG
jgi:hypothetical protein